jgi:dihydroorotate dehydrogenase (NAD+) catalytic subunit
MSTQDLPRYDRRQTYAWNYEHAPAPLALDVPAISGAWSFCGRPVASPLGIPAGPLLNGAWCLYYASLGFDVLTYKTVRSRERACYPLPNLQPVRCGQLAGGEDRLPAVDADTASWAVSFGMPSMTPDTWRRDVSWTRERLGRGKLLSVSVVGSVEPDWTLDRLAEDYAQCAAWAVEAGADVIETNFSCPNVSTCDGQLYQQPADAGRVAARVRAAIGRAPYLVKIGHVSNERDAQVLLEALAPHIDGLAMTNSVAATIAGGDGQLLFEGQRRGICGDATRAASLRQTAEFAGLRDRLGLKGLSLVGVGGASTAEHVRQYLNAGAEGVHLATAVMLDPGVGLAIRRAW